MRTSLFSLLGLSFCLIALEGRAFASPGPQVKLLLGQAVDLQTGKDLYREEHRIELAPNGLSRKIDTSYFSASGELIATMNSDFTKDPFAPDSVFEDKRSGRKEIAVLDPKTRRFEIKRFESKNEEVKTLNPPGDFLAGQGFDNFVRSKFDQLIEGMKLPLRFIVLSEMDEFGFQAFTQKKNEKEAQFSIQLGNWFLRQIVKPIVVTYSREEKKLLKYEGLSNLESPSGSTWQVRIDYSDKLAAQTPLPK